MNRFWTAVCIAFLIAVAYYAVSLSAAEADAPPPVPQQQRPDIFPCVGCVITDRDADGDADMQDLNPVTRMVKQTRSATYRVVLVPGCNYGQYDQILWHLNNIEAPKVGLTLTINQNAYDFTMYISCGLLQVNKCGSINVFCLPDGFPYNCDIYMSDVLSNFDTGSKQGIPIHELIGHCLGTWGEQYQACGSSCGFASTPNLYDVMNTGPLSRHGIEAGECGRWLRTMYGNIPCAVTYGYEEPPPPDCSGPSFVNADGVTYTWNPCLGRWVGSNGIDYDPATGDLWYYGILMWAPCDPGGYRWNHYMGMVMPPGHTFYRPELGYWNTTPAC